MKRILLFFSIFALFTAILANPPPVIVEQSTIFEFVADDLSADFNSVNQELNIEHQEYLQVALPLAFDIPGSLIMETLAVVISAQGANYFWYTSQATINQDVIVWNLQSIDDIRFNSRSYDRLHLATKENEFTVMGLARLDIGENVTFS